MASQPPREFSLPAISQSSRLLTIPAELRAKILKNVLVSDEPIKPARYASDSSWSRSSQLLACCQRLYNEAYGMLYQGNAPAIICDESLGRLMALDIACGVSDRFGFVQPEETLTTLFENSCRSWDPQGPNDHLFERQSRLKTLLQFQYYSVTVTYKMQAYAFNLARILHDLLLDKDAKIVLKCNIPRIGVQPTRRLEELPFLSALRYLECRSLKIEDAGDVGVIHNFPTRRPDFVDTYPLAYHILEATSTIYEWTSASRTWGTNDSYIEVKRADLKRSVMAYDVETVKADIQGLQDMALRRVNNWETTVWSQLRRQIADAERKLGELPLRQQEKKEEFQYAVRRVYTGEEFFMGCLD